MWIVEWASYTVVQVVLNLISMSFIMHVIVNVKLFRVVMVRVLNMNASHAAHLLSSLALNVIRNFCWWCFLFMIVVNILNSMLSRNVFDMPT